MRDADERRRDESWAARYLRARAAAASRAPEVFALLLAAEDAPASVRDLARMLEVDEATARAVLAQWGDGLSRAGRARALEDAERDSGGEDRELNSSWMVSSGH